MKALSIINSKENEIKIYPLAIRFIFPLENIYVFIFDSLYQQLIS